MVFPLSQGETFIGGDQLCKLAMAELELTPSLCSSSYSFIVPEADLLLAFLDRLKGLRHNLSSTSTQCEFLIHLSENIADFAFRTRLANVAHIKSDLEETQTIDFPTMMKMFLVRNRVNVSSRTDIDGLTNRVPSLMKEADIEYLELLQQAIDFCNLDIDKNSSPDRNLVALCKYVKKNMRAL